jgi:hypothetical protein
MPYQWLNNISEQAINKSTLRKVLFFCPKLSFSYIKIDNKAIFAPRFGKTNGIIHFLT